MPVRFNGFVLSRRYIIKPMQDGSTVLLIGNEFLHAVAFVGYRGIGSRVLKRCPTLSFLSKTNPSDGIANKACFD